MREQSAQAQQAPLAHERPVSVKAHDIDDAPPFLGSWRNVYLFVAGELALLVVAFYLLTRWAS